MVLIIGVASFVLLIVVFILIAWLEQRAELAAEIVLWIVIAIVGVIWFVLAALMTPLSY